MHSSDYDMRTGERLEEPAGGLMTVSRYPESTDHRHGGADEGSHGGYIQAHDRQAAPPKPKLCDVGLVSGSRIHECSAEQLFGKMKLVPQGYGEELDNAQLHFFKEKDGMLLSAADGWEKDGKLLGTEVCQLLALNKAMDERGMTKAFVFYQFIDPARSAHAMACLLYTSPSPRD